MRILGGTGGEYDHNQADGLFDFHLRDDAGTPRHAAAVTTANDEHLRRTGSRRARIARKDLGQRMAWACAIAEGAETIEWSGVPRPC